MQKTPGSAVQLTTLRRSHHPACFVCGDGNPHGLGLDFTLQSDGSVRATFACDRRHAGYDNHLHGGISAALLDGAMTNCAFAHGHVSLTAEMTVRYHLPVSIGESVEVSARVERFRSPLLLVTAEISRGGEVLVSARGKFLPLAGAEKS